MLQQQIPPQKKLKLRDLLIIPFVIVISLAVTATGFLSWKYNEESILYLGEEVSEQTTLRIKQKLDSYINHAITANASVKLFVDTGLVDISQLEEMEHVFISLVKSNPKVSTVQVAHPNGDYLGIGNVADDSEMWHKKLALHSLSRFFYVYELPSGKVLSKQPDYDARTRPWFQEAVASEEAVWSSAYIRFSNKTTGITLSEAIRDDQGSLLGVIGTDVVFDELDEALKNIRLTDNSYLFILDEDKRVIAQSGEYVKVNPSKVPTIADVDNGLLTQSVNFIDSNKENETVHSSTQLLIDNKKQSYFINYIPYRHDEGLGWYIGVVTPESDFLGNVAKMKRNTTLIWLFAFASAFLLGLSLTYFINRTIKGLQKKVIETEQSGFMFEHSSQPIQEMNDLSIVFSLMSKRLYESYMDLRNTNKDLEKIIEKHTDGLRETNKRLLEESHTDQLTGLANRRDFDQFLQLHWDNLTNKSIDSITLLMCDLDYFKQYNDLYGHPAGDECLQQFAQVIKQSARETDIVARYGGEEFTIIMPNATAEEGLQVCERIMETFAEKKIIHEGSKVSEFVTTSIGIATSNHKKLSSKFKLINHADMALYYAKQSGRNCFIFYDDYKKKNDAKPNTQNDTKKTS